jgi:ketopantoate reductase
MKDRLKPIVGIIYSEGLDRSFESKHTALYIGAVLASAGYSDVRFVQYGSDGSNMVYQPPIQYYPPRSSSSPQFPPDTDISYIDLPALVEAHVIISLVDQADVEELESKIDSLAFPTSITPTFFGISRGSKNFASMKPCASPMGNSSTQSIKLAVLECVLGFSVVQHPRTGALISTVGQPGMLIERMGKEIEDVADGPCRLLEATGMDIQFRKNVSPTMWGMLVFEHIYALNALSGGTIADTLVDSRWRAIYAHMVRESKDTLVMAGREGWKVDMTLILDAVFVSSIWAFEMLLVLPTPLFYLIARPIGIAIFGSNATTGPTQVDVLQGRKSMANWRLEGLLRIGKAHGKPMPTCTEVLRLIKCIEAASRDVSETSSKLMKRGEEHLRSLQQIALSRGTSSSAVEFKAYFIRFLFLCSLLCFILFFFHLD